MDNAKMEDLTKEIFDTMNKTKMPADNDVEAFVAVMHLFQAIDNILKKAYGRGYGVGYTEGVNASIKIKKN